MQDIIIITTNNYLLAVFGWLVHLSVCQQNNTKTIEQISMKLGWRMGLGPELTPSTFGADRDKGMHLGIYFHFL